MSDVIKPSSEWTPAQPGKSVLAGIRVVDCTTQTAGPMATAFLADLGAEVLKIEEPGRGDPIRGYKSIAGVPLELPHGRRVPVEQQDRNKKSVTINLRKPEGQRLIYELVERSDVFITVLLPKAIQRFKLDYETLSKYNPKLIYASGNVFGESGPDADSPGFDLMAQARSGLMTSSGDEGMPPVAVPIATCDHLWAVLIGYDILAALFARERFGVGQKVSVSQLGGVIGTLVSSLLASVLMTGHQHRKHDRERLANPLWNWYKCKDNKWIAINAVADRKDWWHAICKAFGIQQVENDQRFESLDKRIENSQELAGILEGIIVTKPSAEWDAIIRQSGKFPHSIVNELSDLKDDPQVIANDYILDVDHPILGKIKFPGFPINLSKMPPTFRSIAPEVGQHTEEVLIDILGYSWDEITRLKDKGVI